MKNEQLNKRTKENTKPLAMKARFIQKEINVDENSPALLKKKREAQALLNSNKFQSR